MVKIAVIGFGNIGGGLVELIDCHKDLIYGDCGVEVEVKYIVDIRDFGNHPLKDKIVKDFNIVLNDPEVKIVAEMIGGSHPAYEFTVAALKAGKHVVSSNKEVVANFGDSILKTAAENNTAYLFEAAVGGAIPIIRPMRESLSSDKISYIDGILNGTTNFILTSILNEGKSFDVALAEAQSLGYAEADPTADVDGIDTCRKICILSALAYGRMFSSDQVYTEGIRGISVRDMSDAGLISASIKLIGHTHKCKDGNVFVMVCPRVIPFTNPLSNISDVYNGIFVSALASGELMFYGKGAGRIPTAGAVLSDIVDIVKHLESKQLPPSEWVKDNGDALKDYREVKFDFYCRVSGEMMPSGAEKISFADGEVSFKLKNLTENEFGKILDGYEVRSKIRFL